MPAGLDPAARQYPAETAGALRALGQAVELYSAGKYEAALRALPDQAAADSTAVADYALIYRAQALHRLGRTSEAIQAYSLFRERFPGSALLGQVQVAEGEARVAAGDAAGALAVLQSPPLKESAEVIFWRAQAQERANSRTQAVALYLRIFCEYPVSQEASLARRRLQALAPSYAARKENYRALLDRAGILVEAGGSREARQLLLSLPAGSAPDSRSKDRRQLLLAQATFNLRRSTETLALLKKVSLDDADYQARAIYLEAATYRRLGREKAFLAARDRALRLHPQAPATEELLFSVAAYYDLQNSFARARDAYRALAEAFPTGIYRQRALYRLSVLLFAAGQYEEALRTLWSHLQAENDADSMLASAYWMARCYEKTGAATEASWLFRLIQDLGNNNYYGQRAREAESALIRPQGISPAGNVPSVDFEDVRRRLEAIPVAQAPLFSLSARAALCIERAFQLVAAGLPDPALDELERARRAFPEERTIPYAMSRIHAAQEDYRNVISTMRRSLPGCYNLLPSALPSEVWDLLFPIKHWKPVTRSAAQNQLDPSLILGVIRQESAFDARARSHADARGLMQVLPSTGRSLARQAGIPAYSTGKLYNPETNITLGTRYLASLLRQYDGKIEFALAAYNAGYNRVDRWIRDFGAGDTAVFVELIPFSETRAYVKQVLTSQAHYKLRTASVPTTAP